MICLLRGATAACWTRIGARSYHAPVTSRQQAVLNMLRSQLYLITAKKCPAAAADGVSAAVSGHHSISLKDFEAQLSGEIQSEIRRNTFTGGLRGALEFASEWFVVEDGPQTVVRLTDRALAFKSKLGIELTDEPSDDHVTPEIPSSSSHRKIIGITGKVMGTVDPARPPILSSQREALEILNCVRFSSGIQSPPRSSMGPLVDAPPVKEFEVIDALYRKRGFPTPSDILHIFAPVTPSFAVSPYDAFRRIPRETRQKLIDAYGYNFFATTPAMASFIEAYRMVFVMENSKLQKLCVKLNGRLSPVRKHPAFGSADSFMKRFSQDEGQLTPLSSDREAGSSNPDIDAKIFQILVRHLPRADAPGHPVHALPAEVYAKRYQFIPLVEWINGFPQSDIDVLNQVPQQHVVTIITRYHRVFQLATTDGKDKQLFYRDPAAQFVSEGDVAEMTREPNGQSEQQQPQQTRVDVGIPHAPAALPDEELLGIDALARGDVQEQFDRADAESGETTANDFGDAPHDEDGEFKFEDDEGEGRRNDGGSGGSDAGSEEMSGEKLYVPTSKYDALLIRRLPPDTAPFSLCDLDINRTPEPEILQFILQSLTPPHKADAEAPSIEPPDKNTKSAHWRWVNIQTIYRRLPHSLKRRLRFYKGLTNFIRLHGKLLEVSKDLCFVISHDPSGRISPFVPTQTIFTYEERVVLPESFDSGDTKACFYGDEMRASMSSILGSKFVPCKRAQLLLLDPWNALLDSSVLREEIAAFLPDHPVPMDMVISKLPPVLQAAMPARTGPLRENNPFIRSFMENGKWFVAKAPVDREPSGENDGETLRGRVADHVEIMKSFIPRGGAPQRAVWLCMPSKYKNLAQQEYGSPEVVFREFPQHFRIVVPPGKKCRNHRTRSMIPPLVPVSKMSDVWRRDIRRKKKNNLFIFPDYKFI